MLPVMFAQQPLQMQLRPMDDAEQAEFFERAAAVGEEPATEYGFVGRDLDIQAIEHRLLSSPDSNVLLVQGMAGAGKSTLLAHLAWWWQRTGLVDQVFRFSYEDRAWTAGQIIREIRSRLLSPAEHARADSHVGGGAGGAGRRAAARRPAPAHPGQHRVHHRRPRRHPARPQPRRSSSNLKALLGRLRGGRTLVLLGSREAEAWLSPASAGIETYPLPGLDPQAASVLVERILRRHGATAHLTDPAERKALDELVTLLGGYPLPLTVVLPVLAAATPSAVLAELQAGGQAADPAGLIRRAVEYSHGKLDPALQASLQLLAPFTAVIPTGQILENYQDLLLQDEAVQGLGPVDLAAALDQAVARGPSRPPPRDGLPGAGPAGAALVPAQPPARPARPPGRHRPGPLPALHPARRPAARHAHFPRRPAAARRRAGRVRAEYANLTTALPTACVPASPSPASSGPSMSTWIRPSSMTPAASFSTLPSPPTPSRPARLSRASLPCCTTSPGLQRCRSAAWTTPRLTTRLSLS